ncbi:MAG: hypothetical protein MUF16_15045, partial [Burkholderiaceae bacterium]|nr:hypothetical protein [Burkholderiaceae bacterium]
MLFSYVASVPVGAAGAAVRPMENIEVAHLALHASRGDLPRLLTPRKHSGNRSCEADGSAINERDETRRRGHGS